jgi:hypothetical protein
VTEELPFVWTNEEPYTSVYDKRVTGTAEVGMGRALLAGRPALGELTAAPRACVSLLFIARRIGACHRIAAGGPGPETSR